MRSLLALIILLASTGLLLKGAEFEINVPESTGKIEISSGKMTFNLQFEVPLVSPEAPGLEHWEHVTREITQKNLAGPGGKLIVDEFVTKGLRLDREVWISQQADIFAVRIHLTNLTEGIIHIDKLLPMCIRGPENFQLDDTDPSSWNILVQKRLKNGKPRSFNPVAGQSEDADPLLLINTDDESTPDLFIGFLSHDLHLAHLNLQFGGVSDPEFSLLEAVCDFEDSELPSGGQRTSQWVMITTGDDASRLLFDYGKKVGLYHSVKALPGTPPSVYCTWYYYSVYYDEDKFSNDIETFSGMDLPFDVFLIDECWSMNQWGDFSPNKNFPSGMKPVAEGIRSLGLIPGIWTPPFLVDEESRLASDHPEWTLKNSKGEHVVFVIMQRDHWVLDVTCPGAADYLEAQYRKLSRDWGFHYFKFDFMRAIFLDEDQQFYDKTATSLEAYRKGLEAIRRGVGSDAYISVCGGHYGASLGLADSQRSGSDVLSIWSESEIPKYRQNILRTWMSGLWHVDPDAMMVRRQQEALPLGDYEEITLGLFSDDEARTNAVNQFIGGGLVTFTEDFSRIDEDRKALYKHIIPSVNSPSIPLDIYNTPCPGIMMTRISPDCHELDNWVIISLVNWSDELKDFEITLNDRILSDLKGSQFLVSEFFSQEILDIFSREQIIEIPSVLPHQSKLLRITPWNGHDPVLAGTDLHFSGGGVEIRRWEQTEYLIEGELHTRWRDPVIITAAFPDQHGSYIERKIRVGQGSGKFRIEK